MSKMRLKWLWIVVGIELVAIAGLLVWALVFRQSEETPPSENRSAQQEKPQAYNTPKIELTQVTGGLASPVAIVAMPKAQDNKQLFVVEQIGTIRVITTRQTPGGTPLLDMPFLDIKDKVQSGDEMGLLGLAFHPKVAENNFFYVNYIDKNQNTVIARYNISPQTGRADKASEKVLLKLKQPFPNHNGGDLAFGPDGYLYIGLGDGGSAGDPGNRAQNKDELLGKILRINVDAGDPYAIPADNPFINGGGKPEIWALGLRNPWRFSFDRKTGDLFIADVGQGDIEEINFQSASSKGSAINYGWRCYEGTHEYNTEGCQAVANYVKPILEYDHSENRCSVTGGYVYRGSQFPALDGSYFYGDYCSGQLYYAKQVAGIWQQTAALDTNYSLSTFGQDSSGELYVANYNSGIIYQITDTANP